VHKTPLEHAVKALRNYRKIEYASRSSPAVSGGISAKSWLWRFFMQRFLSHSRYRINRDRESAFCHVFGTIIATIEISPFTEYQT